MTGKVRGGTPQADNGKFTEKYSDDEVLRVLIEAHPEPLTGQEIADRCGFSRATAYNRLTELHDEQELPGLHTKKVGSRARVWWVNTDELDGPAAEVQELPRSQLIQAATRFDPEFNQTHAGNDQLRAFLLEQDFDELGEAVTAVQSE